MAAPLMSDDFKDGQGIVFIGLEGEGDKAKFSLSNEAREFLETVGHGISCSCSNFTHSFVHVCYFFFAVYQ